MARAPEQRTEPTAAQRPGRASRRRRSGWFGIAIAAAAAVVLVGCGSGAAEPKDKDWSEGGGSEQSQQQDGDGNQQSDDDKGSDDKGKGKGEDTVVRGDNADRADKDTAAQAEQFIADYLDAQNKATKNGDFSQVEPMISDCRICSTSQANIEDVYDRGGNVEGSLFTDPKITAGQERDGEVSVTVVATISAYSVTDDSGTEVDAGPAEEQTYQYSVAEREGEWKIVSGRFVQ